MYDQSLPAKHQSLPAKPLHVQVAEALGTVNSKEVPPFHHVTPRYDTSWADCGPLIEKYGICIEFHSGNWQVHRHGVSFGPVCGPTPLVAVCWLLVALVKEGKM